MALPRLGSCFLTLSVVYAVTRRLVLLPALQLRRDVTNDAELLVLRQCRDVLLLGGPQNDAPSSAQGRQNDGPDATRSRSVRGQFRGLQRHEVHRRPV